LLRGIEGEKSKKEKMKKTSMKVMHKHILMTNAIKKGKHEENIGYGILKQYTYI